MTRGKENRCIFDGLRDVRFLTVLFRFVLAFACGAAIGMERSYKNRPAGIRTHILICIGGTVASVTGLYLYLNLHMPTDISRLGAQIVSGLGFIGAGTIVVTTGNNIKGLTTAAGLWASGIIGLAIGAGFYEGAILAACMVLVTEVSFARVGKRIRHSPEFTLAIHFRDKNALDKALRHCKDRKYFITDLQVLGGSGDYMARVELRQSGDLEEDTLLQEIRAYPDIVEADIVQKAAV